MTIANFDIESTVDPFGQPTAGYEQKVDRDLQQITSKSNECIDNINILNNIILDNSGGVTVSDILPLFETYAAETVNFPEINYGTGVYASIDYTIPAGDYIKPLGIHQVEIEKIIDSDNFVKMRLEERDYLLLLRETFGDSIATFQLKIGDNAPLNETVQFVAGQALSISQVAGDSSTDPVKVIFDSSIPYDYYHKSRYNIVPTQPDPTNPYRYKVSTTPYISGSLRVYIDTHRIPESKLDETFAGIGEFRFKSDIPVSELPSASSGDFVTCDFDIPFFEGPEESTETGAGSWWGEIITYTDSTVLTPDAYTSLRFYPVYGAFTSMGSTAPLQIRSSNPYGITDPSIDSVYIILDISQIDHNQLKNLTTANYVHHNLHVDDQFIWKTIIDSSARTMDPQSDSSTLEFTSSDNSVTIDGISGVLDIKSINTHAQHSDDQSIWNGISDPSSNVILPSTTTTQLNLTNSDGLVNIDTSLAPSSVDFALNIQSGTETFTVGQSTKTVTLTTSMANTTYKVFCSLEYVAGTANFYRTMVKTKTVNSFIINLSSAVTGATSSYKVHWLVIP